MVEGQTNASSSKLFSCLSPIVRLIDGREQSQVFYAEKTEWHFDVQ